MQYGHFDTENREYVIDRIDTPCSFTNYLGVDDLVAVVNQTEGGDPEDSTTPCLRFTGMPDGDYIFGGQMITLKNNKATMKGSDTLAGSVISLMEGVRRAISFGIAPETAVLAATSLPSLFSKAFPFADGRSGL